MPSVSRSYELRDGGLTTSDGRLFHMLTILQLKYFINTLQ